MAATQGLQKVKLTMGALSSSSKKRNNNASDVTKRPKWRSKQVENTGEAALLKTLEKVAENPGVKKDDADIFGEYVACSIRKLGQRQQIMARNKIQQVLFEMEMADLGEQGYVAGISLYHATKLHFLPSSEFAKIPASSL